MGRIRTVKPELFRHYDLYKAEQEEGLPLRIAYIGLWTVADREGRFKWIPEQLKIDCLPYDDIDFSRVLHALTTRGFVVKYASNGTCFGHIPTFLDHQVINNREKASTLPDPGQCTIENNDLTRAPRVNDASATRAVHALVEGKGREGKGTSNKPPRSQPKNGEIHVGNLDVDAWGKWVDYRTKIKKPLKPVSHEAAQKKLAALGGDQMAAVDQSIANGWTGLFELKSHSNEADRKPSRAKQQADKLDEIARRSLAASLGGGDL